MTRLFMILAVFLAASLPARSETMRMAVTTSFHNSGLSEVLLPEIQADLGLEVQLLIVGTGQALRLGRAGDADAILVHSKTAEEAFVSEGFGTHRREIMYNDFVLIGPAEDPADIGAATTVTEAMNLIADAKAVFVSRGDDSGTHKAEQRLWTSADVTPSADWYREAGAGMGAALNIAAGMNAYILSDRASWLNFGNKADLALLFAGDPVLFNQYAFLPVNPQNHPHVNAKGAEALEGWLTSDRAQGLIDGYQIGGETLFTFNATPEEQ